MLKHLLAKSTRNFSNFPGTATEILPPKLVDTWIFSNWLYIITAITGTRRRRPIVLDAATSWTFALKLERLGLMWAYGPYAYGCFAPQQCHWHCCLADAWWLTDLLFVPLLLILAIIIQKCQNKNKPPRQKRAQCLMYVIKLKKCLLHVQCDTIHRTYTCIDLSHYCSQQTHRIDPMLVQCWASVVDGGPTLKQHWVNFLCLLGCPVKPLHALG